MKIMLKLRPNGEFLNLATTDRPHGKSRNFLTNAKRLAAWLETDNGEIYRDEDLGNFIEVYRFNTDKITIRFVWLSSPDFNGNLHGYRQTMIIPVDKLRNALDGFRVKVLFDDAARPQSKLSFSESAQEQIRKICRDPLGKRALIKALRDNFHWRDTDEVYMVADWSHDFYFTTDGMNGGLCRHESTAKGRDGKTHRKVAYSMHT